MRSNLSIVIKISIMIDLNAFIFKIPSYEKIDYLNLF